MTVVRDRGRRTGASPGDRAQPILRWLSEGEEAARVSTVHSRGAATPWPASLTWAALVFLAEFWDLGFVVVYACAPSPLALSGSLVYLALVVGWRARRARDAAVLALREVISRAVPADDVDTVNYWLTSIGCRSVGELARLPHCTVSRLPGRACRDGVAASAALAADAVERWGSLPSEPPGFSWVDALPSAGSRGRLLFRDASHTLPTKNMSWVEIVAEGGGRDMSAWAVAQALECVFMDSEVVQPFKSHTTCLLYTSPSPRD